MPNYRLYVVSEGPECFQPIVELFPETEQPPRIVRGDFNYGSPADALVALRRATKNLGEGTFLIAGRQYACKRFALAELETINPAALIAEPSSCRFCSAGPVSGQRRLGGTLPRPTVKSCKLLADIDDDSALEQAIGQMQEDGGQYHDWKCTFNAQHRCRFFVPTRTSVPAAPSARPLRRSASRG